MKLLLSSFLLIFGVGCVAVPSNVYNFGQFRVKTPKDMELVDFELVSKDFSIKAKKISSHNNPDVINSSADGQVKIIEATGNVAAQVAAQAIKAMK